MFQSNFYEFFEEQNSSSLKETLLLCNSMKEAKEICDIATLLQITPFALPDIRVNFGDDLRSYQDEFFDFITTLLAYYKCTTTKVLISPYKTLSLPFAYPKHLIYKTIAFADRIDTHNFKNELYFWGYSFVDIVTTKGEISVRGDVIDIFPINSSLPLRILLLDDEVESIRVFDPQTQRSVQEELESCEIYPAFLALSEAEYQKIEQKVANFQSDIFNKDIHAVGWWLFDGYDAKEHFKLLCGTKLEEDMAGCTEIAEAKRYKDIEVTDINKIIQTHKNREIYLVAKNESVVKGSILQSFDGLHFIYQDGQINIKSEQKLIISLNKPEKIKAKKKKSFIILDELRSGEYVVHDMHGVGLFRGVEKRDILGATKEFLVIVYQNDDLLLVPVENLEVVDRYMSDAGSLPAIDRLGKASFKNLKERVKEKLFAIASQIINLSAQRHLTKGVRIEIDDELLNDFISKAGFMHTSDQEEAIIQTLGELKNGTIMDRLLSADVGFGKTEVAMNVMFAVVKNGYQCCMVAPTTILSSQHFKSLKERFGDYDISVAKLDRFCTTSQKKSVLDGLKNGTIDIVVGTHALLGASFKNLALVVIDEEHKFGVKQKEALKELASCVHLLSMSATPIPRSLNLALSDLKTFSEIQTPPYERVGVRTFVKNYDDALLKEVILRELRRGGQLFYIFNSIASIERKKEEILKLLPNLKITLLHSKMSAVVSEEEMIKFENGEYDMLLSTSIIESGIHMPRANTIIIEGADKFGLADLHQLRGRVGRGSKEGYCYFLVNDKNALSEQAKKRLIALESHSDLGSGAVLAYHDLQIRGGGNIIGEAQSGHIKQIGYGLYLRMLEDAIRELSGKQKQTQVSVEVKLSISAYLNEELISEDRLRLELYRRLSLCESAGEVYEIASEIEDRFGRLDGITSQFIDTMAIKLLARQKGIAKVSNYNENIFFEFFDTTKPRATLKAPSRDDDDIIATVFSYLRG